MWKAIEFNLVMSYDYSRDAKFRRLRFGLVFKDDPLLTSPSPTLIPKESNPKGKSFFGLRAFTKSTWATTPPIHKDMGYMGYMGYMG